MIHTNWKTSALVQGWKCTGGGNSGSMDCIPSLKQILVKLDTCCFKVKFTLIEIVQ
jgi:hypothetical protein